MRDHVQSLFKWGLAYFAGVILFVLLDIIFGTKLSVLEWVSLFGSYSSIFGLIVMLIQFRSVKQTTLETKASINNLLSLTDWTKNSELAHSAQDDIRRDDLSLARYKMQCIKQTMMIIPNNGMNDSDKKTCLSLIKKLYKHISLVDICLLNEDRQKFSKETVISDLEDVSDFLLKMVNLKK